MAEFCTHEKCSGLKLATKKGLCDTCYMREWRKANKDKVRGYREKKKAAQEKRKLDGAHREALRQGHIEGTPAYEDALKEILNPRKETRNVGRRGLPCLTDGCTSKRSMAGRCQSCFTFMRCGLLQEPVHYKEDETITKDWLMQTYGNEMLEDIRYYRLNDPGLPSPPWWVVQALSEYIGFPQVRELFGEWIDQRPEPEDEYKYWKGGTEFFPEPKVWFSRRAPSDKVPAKED